METINHMKKLKAEKKPGPEGIQTEILKTASNMLARPLTALFNMVLFTGRIPKQWEKSDIILLYKKGDPMNISNYRPISLLSCRYKLFTSILLSRIKPQIDKFQTAEQAGFCSGFSTIDHIHTVEQVVEKFKEFNAPLYLAFIDYIKAFNSIFHNSIWRAL